MKTCGLETLEQGYEIIEIDAGLKRPKRTEWASHPLTRKGVKHYSKPGYGVGILAAYTPGLDIDVSKVPQVKEIIDLGRLFFGMRYPRIGRYPRCLFPFRTDQPFKKRKLTYLDPDGDEQAVEWLCEGQQWVAYHIHPDTQQAYQWVRGPLPLREELMLITADDAYGYLEMLEGWVESIGGEVTSNRPRARTASQVDEIRQPLQGWTEGEIRSLLQWIDPDDYDMWIMTGMGLWHQSQGAEWGFELWDWYSQRSGKYDPDYDWDGKWESFQHTEDRDIITLRSLIKISEEGKRDAQNEEKQALIARVEDCQDLEELRGDLRTDIMLSGINDPLWYRTLCQAWMLKFKTFTGVRISMAEARKELEISDTSRISSSAPDWLDNWHYVIETETFVRIGSRNHMSRTGFSDRYMREASQVGGTTGSGRPTIAAADLALNQYGIPKVDAERYRPGKPEIFEQEGSEFLNTYDPDSVPELSRERYDEVEAALDAHWEMMFKNPKERKYVLQWIANLVQHPDRRNQTVLLIRGPQGVGKNTLGRIAEVAIGEQNASSLTAETLSHTFTDWAVGYQLVTIEEVKLHGHDRHQVVNRLKIYITEERIEIHPKGRPAYKTQNATSYMAFTNFRDALPVGPDDRRFFVCETGIKHEVGVRKFIADNPEYFHNLYELIRECPGEIREYFLNVDLKGFSHTGAAPMTKIREHMGQATKSPLIAAIEDLIEDQVHPMVRWDFLSSNTLNMLLHSPDAPFEGKVNSRLLQHALSNMGYRVLGRYRLQLESTDPGARHRVWLRSGSLGDEDRTDLEIYNDIKRQLDEEQELIG